MKKIKIIKKDPAAVWHGGRNLPPYRSAAGSWRRPPCPAAMGYGARCTFLENFDSTIYFSKIMTT
jgi:hypothetical protein